jgi:ABC-type sugar transport system substrate-binding protein
MEGAGMQGRRLISLAAALALAACFLPVTGHAANEGKTTICHATGSTKNPYVRITVSNSALTARRAHQDGRDIIPATPGCVRAVDLPTNEGPGNL